MNRFLRTLCALVMLAMVAPVFAATDVEAVKQRVAKVDVLRGEFTQEKQVAGFKNPLRSQGRFVLAQDHGVVWTTLKPFPSEVVVTRDRILSRQSDGSSRVELDGRQQPAMRSVNAIMFALMSGDAQALSAQFTVKVEVLPGNAWRMQLTPRSAMLGKVFAQLTLSGDRYVREVQINEANQDVTRIHFAGMSDTPAALSADEGRKFE
ncbi:outer membrane lipoprotein carrier protein LolA [Stenotrophomonas sp.]|jgi:outer membrane lipoprotein-sorting protein|uniref:outer membrane lipoprotein carrier protein LolA n=1 Tax=Stenotrophomonas sp. TaxID=69392 RepID=UPI0025E283BE|nr:outer membrane lipoprotein carrier protein LolA [Stenotrophomonas sp.]MBW8374068.1 outer membrane lipoprotein carrier protein LolA [Stenotrophomonas sp.]